MTEFALILPIFMVIVAGLLGFGRVFFTGSRRTTWQTRAPAGRSSTATHIATSAPAAQHTRLRCRLQSARTARQLLRDRPTPSASAERDRIGDPLKVTVEKPFAFVPILGIDKITIRASSTMRVENLEREGCRHEAPIPTAYTRGCRHERSLRDEGGQVIVLAAVMIPVLSPLRRSGARRRQLVHAQAAAPEPGGCGSVRRRRRRMRRTGRPACRRATLHSRRNTAQEIADAARAASPGTLSASDYAGGTLPASLYNTEIANQNKLNVNVNSTTYDNTDAGGSTTDFSDDDDGIAGTRLGNPCSCTPKAMTSPRLVTGPM